MGQNLANSITGNIPKAVLCVGQAQMQVQYNPNAIHISSHAGSEMRYAGGNLGSASDNQIIQMVHPTSTTMSFQLIFDDMNPQDAFMLENIAPTAGNAISAGANIIKKASGKEYSVQTQIDGLMSLLTQDRTREITFHWAELSFGGRLESVSSRYTMFNKHGNPIRGIVDISICQEESNTNKGNNSNKGQEKEYWNQAFHKAFDSNTQKSGIDKIISPVEKAIITIRMANEPESESASAKGSSASRKALIRLKPVPMEGSPERGTGLGGIAGALNRTSNVQAEAASSLNESRQPSAGPADSLTKQFMVQFNPSELSISGYGGGMVQKMDYTQGGKTSFEEANAQISLSVKLIFDKADTQDAFMADKWNASPTALAANAVKAAKSLAGKSNHSVQTEVEGFVAALYSPRTREITFGWGNMSYTGILNGVSARYTMFNVQGIPIRAEVTLSMLCVDKVVSEGSMGSWEAGYNKAFGQGSSSYVNAAQKVGNLLNFNL